jgi:transcriptional regulator with XRE-family HTH domain
MSRGELQQKTKIHRNTIARYENGDASPTLKILAVLADALGYELKVNFVKREVTPNE